MLPHADQHFGCFTYAQQGEDLMILNMFKLIGILQPSYLDLGAHHPSIISNTKLLYERGSRGVNIEANANLLHAFNMERPHDKNVNLAVVPENTEISYQPFYMFSDTSGCNTLSPLEVKHRKDVLDFQSAVMVPTRTIDQIVNDHCGGIYPDFLNCDIEGLDFDVLQSATFLGENHPDIICVEVRNHQGQSMHSMLQGKGFEYHCRMGENMLFVHVRLKHAL